MFMQTSMERNSREWNGNSHEQSITYSFETKYSYISIGQIHDITSPTKEYFEYSNKKNKITTYKNIAS